MATTTAFSSLSVPAPDDTMEMSSPANRNLDDDIDIDFGDYQGDVNQAEDERMLEDGDTRPATATDDMMEDDLLPGEVPQIQEETMKDDVSQIEEAQQPADEELIDYDEEEEQIVEDAVPSVPEQPVAAGEIGFVQLGEDASAVVESAPTEIPGVALQEDLSAETAHADEAATAAEGSLRTETLAEDNTGLEDHTAPVEEPEAYEVDEETATDQQTHEVEQEERSTLIPPAIDTAVSASTDTPGTPTDTGLHPMNIRYGDMVFPLFKSKHQPDGLLKGDNLVHLSLADLIRDCRQRLALKIGEDISEDHELVLGFEPMGLMLLEDCRDAFQNSLHDVLQVYLQLHENDGSQDVPPLSLSLTLQLKFASSFAILKEAAAGGQGMSTFNFLQSTGNGQFDQEEYEETGDFGPHGDYYQEEGLEGQDYGDGADTHHEEGAELDQGEHFQDQYNAGGEHGEESYDHHYEDDQYPEQGEEHFYIHEEDEAAARLDELEEGHRYEQGLLATAFEDPGVAADEVTVAKPSADSAASSPTVHGDSANNSAEQDAVAHEDYSTFLTEYEEDHPKDDQPEGGATFAQDQAPVDGSAARGQAADILGSEDFLHDPTGQEYTNEDQEGEQAAEGEDGTGENEEYNFDQADNYDEQYDETHPDYQPGEENEQYQTAHDFLNLEEYEHGPEHNVYGEDEQGLDDTLGTVIHHETAGDQEYEEGQDDFGDDIGFDEEDESTLQNGGTGATSGSPTGKRSFDELEEFDDEDDREIKKARPS